MPATHDSQASRDMRFSSARHASDLDFEGGLVNWPMFIFREELIR